MSELGQMNGKGRPEDRMARDATYQERVDCGDGRAGRRTIHEQMDESNDSCWVMEKVLGESWQLVVMLSCSLM